MHFLCSGLLISAWSVSLWEDKDVLTWHLHLADRQTCRQPWLQRQFALAKPEATVGQPHSAAREACFPVVATSWALYRSLKEATQSKALAGDFFHVPHNQQMLEMRSLVFCYARTSPSPFARLLFLIKARVLSNMVASSLICTSHCSCADEQVAVPSAACTPIQGETEILPDTDRLFLVATPHKEYNRMCSFVGSVLGTMAP